MATIDQKVVEMRFDNAQFEQGASQSLSTINKLKDSLSFTDSSNATTSAFKTIGNGVEDLVKRFSFLGQKLMEVKNYAFALTKSLTVDQVTAGWSKYAEITKATQTIMSATRSDIGTKWADQEEQMEYVNGQLEKLNWFTDETSYNLTDMTSNIGKFTAAGIDLDKATDSMMGIATWAGLSGASVEQASRAMYNLSQAMGQGALKVQDWMSIENANMATKEFKETLIQAGLETGTLKKVGNDIKTVAKGTIVTAENLRSTLSEGWATSGVLTQTLKKYGDFASGLYKYTEKTGMTATQLLKYIGEVKDGSLDLANSVQMANLASNLQVPVEDLKEALEDLSSEYNDLGFAAFRASQEAKTFQEAIDYTKDAASTGWMNTFRTIFGDYLESKELWTSVAEEMYDVFLEDLDRQNTVLKQWGEMGGREKILNAVENLWGRIKGIMMSIKDAFREVFPPITASRLMDITEAFESLEYVLSMTEWQSDKLKTIFENLFSGFKNIGTSIKNILASVIPALDDLDLLPKDAFKEGGVLDWISKVAENFKSVTYIFSVTKAEGSKFSETFKNVFYSIKTAVQSVINLFKAVGNAFIKMFPHDSEGILFSLSSILVTITDTLAITDDRADKLERAFSGLLAVIDILRMLVVALLEPFIDLNGENNNLVDGIFNASAAIGDWLVSVRDWLKENDTFHNAVQAVVNFFKKIPVVADKVCNDLFGIGLDQVWENIKNAVSIAWGTIKEFFTNLPTYANNVTQVLFGLNIDEVWEKIKNSVKSAWESIKEFFAIFKKDKNTLDDGSEKGNGFANSLDKINNNIETLKRGFEVLKPYLDEFMQALKENTNLKFDLGEWGENKGDALKNFGVFGLLISATGLLTEFFMMIRKFNKNSGKISDSIKKMFDTISSSIKSLGTTLQNNIKAQTFKTIATAILEIAAAIFILCLLPSDKMIIAASAIAFLMGELALAFSLISRTDTSEKELKQLKGMLGMVEVILATLAGAIYLIASQTEMGPAISAAASMAVLLGEIGVFFTQLDKVKISEEKVKYMTKLIAAICLLISAIGVSLFVATSGLGASTGTIAAAGTVIGGILSEIGLFMTNLDKTKLTKTRVNNIASFLKAIIPAIVAIGIAVMAMTFTGADWTQIAAAGGALSLVLMAIAAAMNIMPSSSKMEDNAKALTVVALALLLIGSAIAIVALVPTESLLPGITALAIMLAAIGVALKVMGSGSDDMIKGAAALAIAATSLIMMAVALGMMAAIIQSGHAAEALIIMGAALAVLVVAAYACANPAIQSALYAIGISIALIGVGALAAGTGLLMFANAVERLVAVGPDGVIILMQAIKEFFALLPSIVTNVVEAIGNFIDAFVATRDKFLKGFVTFFMIILEAIRIVIPKIIQVVKEIAIQLLSSAGELLPHLMEFLTQLFFAINDFIWVTAPEITATVIMLIRELLNAIVTLTPEITAAFFTILIDTLTQIRDNIAEIVALLTEIVIETILGTIDGITAEIPNIMDSIWNFWITLINSFADGLDDHAAELHEAIIHLCESVINAVKEFFGIQSPSTKFSDIGVNLIQGLINGITSMGYAIWEKITKLAKAIMDWFKEKLGIHSPSSEFDSFGVDIVQGLINGISGMFNKVKEKVQDLGRKVVTWFEELLDINSPSKVFTELGQFIDQGLINGLDNYSNKVGSASEAVGQTAIDSMASAISGISSVIDEEIDSDPTIKPVLDLTDVTNGVNTMDEMLNSNRALSLAASSNVDMNRRIVAQNNNLSAMESLRNALSGFTGIQNGSVTNNNTFNITGDDPRAIAEEVNKVLQFQIERKDAVWE